MFFCFFFQQVKQNKKCYSINFVDGPWFQFKQIGDRKVKGKKKKKTKNKLAVLYSKASLMYPVAV